jgi:hypothetical protein
MYYDILAATASAIENALLDGWSLAQTPVVRKRPFFSESHGDAYPKVLVCPSKEEVARLHQPNGVWWDYPVYVVFVQGEAGRVQSSAEIEYHLGLREAIRDALWVARPFGDELPVFHTDYDPHPAFDLQGLDKHYDVSVQLFKFRTAETR